MKNMLVAQSGGPSAAINATIAGVIDAGIQSDQVEHVYGALHGIKGVLNENFVNLDEICNTKEKRDLLAITPAAARTGVLSMEIKRSQRKCRRI